MVSSKLPCDPLEPQISPMLLDQLISKVPFKNKFLIIYLRDLILPCPVSLKSPSYTPLESQWESLFWRKFRNMKLY